MKKCDKTITVTGYGGYEHEQTIKEFIMDVLPLLCMLGLVIFGIVLALDYKNEKPKYDTAVIVGEPSIVVHIDHYYESTDGRYMLYDKDGKVYNVDKQYVVFYNYKED